jgi:hypothetical protein
MSNCKMCTLNREHDNLNHRIIMSPSILQKPEMKEEAVMKEETKFG